MAWDLWIGGSRDVLEKEATVSFEKVDLISGSQKILSDVSFDVHPGEHWVILGPNGAGKTSLFNIASARLRPSNGRTLIFGEQLGKCDMRLLRRRIGISSAAIGDLLRNDLLVFEVVLTGIYGDLAPWWHTYSDSDLERAQMLLSMAGVETFSQRQYGSLSAGEKQQVLIARALISDPDLLLLDEPTSGLDLGARERFLERLDVLLSNNDDLSLLVITHHVEDIPISSTNALMLKNGSVLSSGSISEVLIDKNLSSLFEYPLRVEKFSRRYRAISRDS